MAKSKKSQIALVSAAIAMMLATASARAAEPHRSVKAIPASNGRAAIAYDVASRRVNQFLEHPYRYPSEGKETRNFAYDSYPGVRVGSSAAWLTSVAPTRIEYLSGTGIVHTTRTYADVALDEYHFTPIGLAENASVMIVKATRASGSGAIDAYALFNFHLGAGSPSPGSGGEQIAWNAQRNAFYEWGPSGVAIGYGSIGAAAAHASSPENPYAALLAGANLANNAGTNGSTNDAVAGLQASLGDLAVGASAHAGWFTVLSPNADAQAAVDRVRAWIGSRSAEALLQDEIAAWGAWVTPPPAGANGLEAELAKQSQVILRMGQVTEAGKPAGQMLASLATGKWNISWVRDMAYAVMGLLRTGHLEEAKAAIAFQMGAEANRFESYVGAPYQISVVRYFGEGVEESDKNEDGWNIEFDGFGLFLWTLDEYVRASGDTATLAAYWPVVKSKIADVLVKLQESSGLVAADSSIWEVHWNGKQRHFAYTTITAANGLCSAARLAEKAGDTSSATALRAAGVKARDAILTQLRAPDGTITQSTEGLAKGSGWMDAAVVEALNFGLVHPRRRTARATLASIKKALVPPSGRGFMRNDVGGWYDSQEWIFVDFRTGNALRLNGDSKSADSTFEWNVLQATENFRQISELHERVTADYVGEAPMVGFGAGSYLLALHDRGKEVVPTCGDFASEPAEPNEPGDGGASEDGGRANPPVDAGARDGDAGANGVNPAPGDDGCGCTMRRSPANDAALFAIGAGVIVLALRRRRT